MREFTVQSGSATLACEERGSGPCIVALHAGVADRRSWRQMGDALDGFRLVSYDRRGFGTTTYEAATEGTAFSHIDDLAAVVAAIGERQVVLVGNSMGGGLALAYALEHPEQVRALVLIAPAVDGLIEFDMASVPPHLMAIWEEEQAASKAGDLDRLNQIEARLWLDGPEAPQGRVTGPARDLFLDMNGIALRAPETGTEREVEFAWDRLDTLDIPILAILGDLDEPTALPPLEALVARAPNARLLRLPDVAHLPQIEQPEAIAALVREVASQQG